MKSRLRSSALVLLATLLLLPAFACMAPLTSLSKALPAVDTAKISTALDKYMSDSSVPGVVLGLWVPAKGEIVIARGLADREAKTPITRDMLFRIGSNTKTFTATVILQLAAEGKLSLNDKLAKYDSRFPYADQITLRHLLNHTCGIYSYTESPDFVKTVTTQPLKKWTYEELMNFALAGKPNFPPGQGLSYSNTAYLILGRIIEQVTGNKAADEMKTRIIDRLGLINTYMAEGPDLKGNFSHGYTFDYGNGLQDATRQELGSWGWTAGALVSNLDDMKICAEAFVTGRLLNDAMKTEYLTWTPIPGGLADSYTGLGIVRLKDLTGNSGSTSGCGSWMWHMPATGATLVAFFNQHTAWPSDNQKKENAGLTELLRVIMEVM